MIYENVKALCERENITIKKLEERAGIGNGVIGKWAKGREPNIAILRKVASALGVKVTTLLKE